MENPHKFILLAPPALTRLIREVADEPGAAAVVGGFAPRCLTWSWAVGSAASLNYSPCGLVPATISSLQGTPVCPALHFPDIITAVNEQ